MKKALLIFLFAAASFAQTGVVPFRSPRATFTDQNGLPLAGGCVFTYSGGTSTPQATYTDYTGSTPNSNPVILDSTGSAVMWLSANTYKYAVWSNGGTNCATGTLEWTVDQVPGDVYLNATLSGPAITGGTVSGAAISGGTDTGTAVTGDAVDSTPIGQTTPAAGSFTSLTSAVDNLVFSVTPIFNSSLYGYFTLTLSANVTSSTISGGAAGQEITFNLCQGSAGGYTFGWPASVLNPPAVNQSPNACTIATLLYQSGVWNTQYSNVIYGSGGNYLAMAFSATPVFTFNSYSNFNLTLTANVTSSSTAGGVTGQISTLNVCQNATGGYTFAWPAGTINAPVVTATASACTGVTMVIDNNGNLVVVGTSTTGAGSGAFSQVLIPSPAGPASTSAFTMQGMAGAITPSSSGRVEVNYTASLSSCGISGGDGIYLQFYYGTGTAPTNGAAVTGTNVTISANPVQVQYITGGANLGAVPISANFAVTGLTVGTAYWFDVAAEAATATGCAATKPVLKLQEF